MSIGCRIKERRAQLGLTQLELAKIVDVTKGAIANYENEVSIPKPDIMYKLFIALDCDANYLYQDDITSPSYKNSINFTLSLKEQDLVSDFRELSKQGQEYILQTMDLAKSKYMKTDRYADVYDIDSYNSYARIAAVGHGTREIDNITEEDDERAGRAAQALKNNITKKR